MSSQFRNFIDAVKAGAGEVKIDWSTGSNVFTTTMNGKVEQDMKQTYAYRGLLDELDKFYGRADDSIGNHYLIDYMNMSAEDIESLVKIKTEATAEHSKTGKWNPVYTEKANAIRSKYGILKDATIKELETIKDNKGSYGEQITKAHMNIAYSDLKRLIELREKEKKLRAENVASGGNSNYLAIKEIEREVESIRKKSGVTEILHLEFLQTIKDARDKDLKKPDFSTKPEHQDQHKTSGTYDYDDASKNKSPDKLDYSTYQNLKLNGTVNVVTVKQNGKIIDVLFGHVTKDGVTYIENFDGTGQRLVGNAGCKFKYEEINISGMQGGWSQDYKNRYETVIDLKPIDLTENLVPPPLIDYVENPDDPKYEDLLDRPDSPVAEDLITSIQKPGMQEFLDLPKRPKLEDLVRLPKEPVLKKLKDIPEKPPMQPLLEYPSRPELPIVPEYSVFDVPQPAISIDPTRAEKYKYFFGIDSIELSYVDKAENSCFVSEPIYLGDPDKTTYVELDAKYSNNSGCIEFYIIDGTEEVPIVPSEDQFVSNELFINKTRFEIDKSEQIEIKKDGASIDATLDELKAVDGATISYTPLDIDSHKKISVKNKMVQIKAIIRCPKKELDAPSIDKMTIKRYGSDMLWQNDILSL